MWRIELFDGLRAQSGEIVVTRFRTQKTAALLAYLAFFPTSHTRDFLIELLWPNVSLETGRNNLRLALASLRRQFEPPGTPQDSVIVAGRIWVQLHPQAVTTDVQEFESLLAEAQTVVPEVAAPLWKQALDLYQGPLLRGYSEDWIPVEEQRLENLMLGATRRLIKFYEAQDDVEAVQYYTHKAARVSRDAEMRIEAERLLHRNQESQKTHETHHSSKSKNAKSLEIETPLIPALSSPALPPRLTRFFGRENESAQILALLDDSQTHLITLAGPGGCGKTRLALEIAWHFHEQHPGAAVCFAPLTEVREANFIADAIAKALLLPPPTEPIEPAIERVIKALRQNLTCLLVLDNFEQLVPDGEQVVRQILEAVPSLHCLITSRQVLAASGELEVHLQSLAVPPSDITEPARLQEFDAVRLFVDRARARRADFQITPHNAADLAELLRRIDGLPLAIEICAARANVLSPHQMLLQLERDGELAGDARLGLAPRQNSLRATFEWSYDLLTSNLQCVLRHLSLFRGSFSLDAAQAVCTQIPILSSLAFLRDASLVQSEEKSVASGHSEMRFSLLDTVLNFAAEKLGADESFSAHERHALFYVTLAESARNLALTFTADWQSVLTGEFDNITAALQWSVDTRLDLALRLIVALQGYWATYDPARGRVMLENVVAHLRNSTSSSLAEQARILLECGEMAVRQADLARGQLWLQQSLELSCQLHDTEGEAVALTSLGLIALEQSDTNTAQQNLSAAEAIYRSSNDARGLGWTLRHQGVLACRAGDYEKAQALLEESLSLFQSVGDESGKAWLWLALGELELDQGTLGRAADLCAQAERAFRELGHKTGLMWALQRCGEIAWRLGDDKRARLHFEEGLHLARQLHNQAAIDLTLRALDNLQPTIK